MSSLPIPEGAIVEAAAPSSVDPPLEPLPPAPQGPPIPAGAIVEEVQTPVLEELPTLSRDEKHARLRALWKTTIGKEPTLDAEVTKIAEQLQTSKKLVLDNLPRFRALAEEADFDPAELERRDPVLYGLIGAHPELAVQVKGAVQEDLSAYRRILRQWGALYEIMENEQRSQAVGQTGPFGEPRNLETHPLSPYQLRHNANLQQPYTEEQKAEIMRRAETPRTIEGATIDPLANQPPSFKRSMQIVRARAADDFRHLIAGHRRAMVAEAMIAGASEETLRELREEALRAKIDAGGYRHYGEQGLLGSFSDAAQAVQSSVATLAAGGTAVAAFGVAAAGVSTYATGSPAAGLRATKAAAPIIGRAGGAVGSFHLELGGFLTEADGLVTDKGERIDENLKLAMGVTYAGLAAAIEVANEFGPGLGAFGPAGKLVESGNKKAFARVMLSSGLPFLKKVAARMGGEAVEEGLQQSASELGQYATKSIMDGELNNPDFVAAAENILGAAGVGALAGGGMGVAQQAIGTVARGVFAERVKLEESASGEKRLETVRGLGKSQTAQISPTLAGAIVDGESAASGTRLAGAYVDPAAIVAHFQTKGEDPIAAVEALDGPGAGARLSDAMLAGSKYEVTTQGYVGPWTQSGLADAVKDDTAAGPGLYTPHELDLEERSLEERAAAIVRESQPEQTDVDLPQADALEEQLEATGQTPEDADTVGAMHRAFIETVAARSGVDPSTVMADLTVESRGVPPAVLPTLRTEFGALGKDEQERAVAQQRAVFTDLATGLLNARGDAARALDPARPMRATFAPPSLKAINDAFGHDAGDDIIRTMARTIAAALPDAAVRQGDIVVDVADQAQADQIAEAMSQAIDPEGRLQVVASVAQRADQPRETNAALKLEKKRRKAEAVASGRVGDRGALPPAFPDAEALRGSVEQLRGKGGAELAMSPELAAAFQAEGLNAPEAAYLDESGLLNGRGFDGAIRFKGDEDQVLAGDIRFFGAINEAFGEENTDAILRLFFETIAERGGGAINAAHPSGDEIGAVARPEKLREAVREWAGAAKRLLLYSERDDGSIVMQDGLTFAVGTGISKGEAETQLIAAKADQDNAGDVSAPQVRSREDGYRELESLRRSGGRIAVRVQGGVAQVDGRGAGPSSRAPGERRGGGGGVGGAGAVPDAGGPGGQGSDVPGSSAGAAGRGADRAGIRGASAQGGPAGRADSGDAAGEQALAEQVAAARAENERLKRGLRDPSSPESQREAAAVAKKLQRKSEIGTTAKSVREAFEVVMERVGGIDASPTEQADSRTRAWLAREPAPLPRPPKGAAPEEKKRHRADSISRRREWLAAKPPPSPDHRVVDALNEHLRDELDDKKRADFKGVTGLYEAFRMMLGGDLRWEGPKMAAAIEMIQAIEGLELAGLPEEILQRQAIAQYAIDAAEFHGAEEGDVDTSFDPDDFETLEQPRRRKTSKQAPTETPAFKKWFAASKVVDAEGKPLRLYHGGAAGVTSFDPDRAGSVQRSDWGKGVYFTPSRWMADGYRDTASVSADAESNRLYDEYETEAKRLGTTPMSAAIDLGYGSEPYNRLQEFEKRWRASLARAREEKSGEVYEVYLRIENPLRYTYQGVTDPFLAERAKAGGHDGVIIVNDEGVIEEVVVFRPEQIKSATGNRGTFDPDDPNILHQPTDGDTPRGQIQIGREAVQRAFRVFVTQYQNNSTRLHELAHGYFEMLGDLSEAPTATEQVKADWHAALRYLGAADRKSLTREQKEKWARSFEAYLLEGKPPSGKLVAAFQRMRLWLLEVYKHVKNLNVELDNEVRGVFDRLLATDDEIASMRAAMGISGEAFDGAAEEARLRVQREIAEEQKRVASKAWQAELKKARAVAGAEYDAQSAARARRFMLDQKQRWKETTPDLDTFAEMFGYPTGKAMLDDMATLPERDVVVRGRADEIARAANPEILAEHERLEQSVVEALHSEGTVDALLGEWAILLRRARAQGLPDKKALQRVAEETVGRMPARRLDPTQALQRELRMAESETRAAAKGDFVAAADAKSKQILAHMQWKEIRRARQDRERFDELTAKLAKRKYRERLGQAGAEYRDVVDALLEALGVVTPEATAEPRRTPGELVKVMEDNGQGVVFDPAWLADLIAKPRSWRDFTVAEMRTAHAALTNIKKGATERNTFLLDGRRVAKESFVEEAGAEAAANMPDLGPKTAEAAMTLVQRGLSVGASLDGSKLRQTVMVSWLGGDRTDSIWHRAIIKPLRDAAAYESDLMKQTVRPLMDALEAIPESARKRWNEKIDGQALFPDHREDIVPARAFELLIMLLNLGNASNIDRLTRGRGITLEQVVAAIEGLGMPREVFVWAQSVWDASESLWPLASALEERETGVAPDKLDLAPFVIQSADGPVEMKGGYFPAIYDKDITKAGSRQAVRAVSDMLPAVNRPSTSRGYLKSRVEDFADAIDLSPRGIQAGIVRVTHDIAFREAIKSVAGLVLDPKVQEILRRRLGTERRDTLKQWLQDIGRLDAARADPHAPLLMRFAQQAKSNLTMAVLGHAVDNFVADTTAILQSPIATKLRAKHAAAGLAEFMASPRKVRAFTVEKSAAVRERDASVINDFRKAVTTLGKSRAVPLRLWRWYRDTGFYVAHAIDAGVSSTIWIGAYRQAAHEGRSDADAVAFADDVLHGSMPSGSVVDTAALQRDRGLLAQLNVFYGFYSLLYNQYRRLAHPIHTAKGAGATSKAIVVALSGGLALTVVHRLIAGIIMGKGPEPDDGEDEGERWLMWALRGLLAGPLDSLGFGLGREFEQRLLGKRSASRPLPANAMFDAVEAAVRKATKEDADPLEASIAAIRALGIGSGTPIRPLRAIKYLAELADPDSGIEARGPFDVAAGLLYGQREGQPENIPTMLQDTLAE